MRVLMTADTVGGGRPDACGLVRALGLHGVDVTLATMGAPPTAVQRKQVAAYAALESSTFALEWMPEPWRDVDAAAPVWTALTKNMQGVLLGQVKPAELGRQAQAALGA